VFLERKRRSELLVHVAVVRECVPGPGFALRVQREEFSGDVADLLRGAALGAFPGVPAEGMQRGEFRSGAGIARDQVQLGTGTYNLSPFA
jgi:hypothetical protein